MTEEEKQVGTGLKNRVFGILFRKERRKKSNVEFHSTKCRKRSTPTTDRGEAWHDDTCFLFGQR
jgi:hypothetical protein